MYRGRNFRSIMKRRGGGSFFCNLHQINWIHIDFQCSLLTFNWLNDLTKNVYKQIRVSMRTKTFAKKCEHFCSYFEFFRETDLSKILQKSETFRIFRELTKCEKMWNYRRNFFSRNDLPFPLETLSQTDLDLWKAFDSLKFSLFAFIRVF